MKSILQRTKLFIILLSLFIYNCATWYTLESQVMINPRPNELPVGEKIGFFDNPLEISSSNNNLMLRVFCIRRSKSIKDYNNKILEADGKNYVILTVKFYNINPEIRYPYKSKRKSPYGMVENCYINATPVFSEDVMLSIKDVKYPFFAFAFGHNDGSRGYFDGYFLNYEARIIRDNTCGIKAIADNNDKIAWYRSFEYTNLVFEVPEGSDLDKLIVRDNILKFPTN